MLPPGHFGLFEAPGDDQGCPSPGTAQRGGGAKSPSPGMVWLSKPPVSNTGVQLTSALSVGWLSGSFQVERLKEVEQLLEQRFGPFAERNRGLLGRSCSKSTASGVLLGFSRVPIRHGDDLAVVSIPGSCLEGLPVSETLKLFAELLIHGVRCSRLDCAFDDYTKSMSPRTLWRVLDVGQRRGVCPLVGFRVSEFRASHHSINGSTGDTLSFGRRGKNGSGKFIRFYEKHKESKGKIDANRWELELSGKLAAEAFGRLACSRDDAGFATWLGAFIGGSIDFRQRSACPGEVHLKRIPRLPWWERIIEIIGESPFVVTPPVPTMAKKEAYVRRSFAKPWVMVIERKRKEGGQAAVERFFDELMQEGENRLTAFDRALIVEGFDPERFQREELEAFGL